MYEKAFVMIFFFNAAVLACAETASATKMQAGQSSYRCLSVIGR